jgi:tetrahydromethanopterin S-methyltransferase subunit F
MLGLLFCCAVGYIMGGTIGIAYGIITAGVIVILVSLFSK